MSYQLHAPSDDPKILKLRAKYDEHRRRMNATMTKLYNLLPTPRCRLCKVGACDGMMDWTICAPCWNRHNGKPPAP